MFKVEIRTEGEAFHDDPGAELARILLGLAELTVQRSAEAVKRAEQVVLRDANGNKVGVAAWSVCAIGCGLEDGHPGDCFVLAHEEA